MSPASLRTRFIWRLAGTARLMPWIVKGLFILIKTRRGRELLFAAGLAVIELAQDDRARKLYARAQTRVSDSTATRVLARNARRAVRAIRL